MTHVTLVSYDWCVMQGSPPLHHLVLSGITECLKESVHQRLQHWYIQCTHRVSYYHVSAYTGQLDLYF